MPAPKRTRIASHPSAKPCGCGPCEGCAHGKAKQKRQGRSDLSIDAKAADRKERAGGITLPVPSGLALQA
jgi:hypothetical protein